MNFRKIILQIFSEIHDRSIIYNGKNLQYKFSENSSVLELLGIPKSNTYKNIKRCIVRFALVRGVDHFWEEEWWAGPE